MNVFVFFIIVSSLSAAFATESKLGKNFSIVGSKQPSPEEVKAISQLKQLELDPQFKIERKNALEFLKINHPDELRKNTSYFGPIDDVFELESAVKPDCKSESFTKLKNVCSLSALMLLKRELISMGSDVSIGRIMIRANFDRLGREGKLNSFPRLNTYYSSLKVYDSSNQDSNTTKLFEQRRLRRDKAIKELATKLLKFGVTEPSTTLFKMANLAPECFTFSGSRQFEELLEKDRMTSEGPVLLLALKTRYEREGKVRPDLYDLDLNKDDPTILRRDAWGTPYLLQLTDKELSLRSLGPDKMLSADDVNLGSFPLKQR